MLAADRCTQFCLVTNAGNFFLLCEYATLNGGERSMLATLDGVRAAGFTPVVMVPPQGPLAWRWLLAALSCCRWSMARPREIVGRNRSCAKN